MINTNNNFSTFNPKIEVFEVIGGLIGNEALEVQNYLFRCLDEGKCYQIIDLEQTNQIDGIGIAVFENFISRGLQIRIINVKPEVKSVISMAKKESLFRIICNEKDRAKAASLFKRDILEKKVLAEEGIMKKRHHIRINTSFPSEFKFRRNHETASGRANILNLSEGGVLAGHLVAVKENKKEIVPCLRMVEQDIYDLKFKLNGDSAPLTLQGTCVREFISGDSIYAGIRFKETSQSHREIIRTFVDVHKWQGRTSGQYKSLKPQ